MTAPIQTKSVPQERAECVPRGELKRFARNKRDHDLQYDQADEQHATPDAARFHPGAKRGGIAKRLDDRAADEHRQQYDDEHKHRDRDNGGDLLPAGCGLFWLCWFRFFCIR